MQFYRAMRLHAAKIEGDRSATFDLARGRLVVISTCFALIYMVLAVRAFDLSVLQGAWLQGEDEAHAIAEQDKSALRRGNVYDRNGALVASSIEMPSLYADPRYIADPQKTAQALVSIFPELSRDALQRSLSGKRHFIWVKRNISPDEQAKVMEIGEPGLNFRYEYKRVYPNKSEMAHILGTTDVDGKGLVGVERSFDSQLTAGQPVHMTLDARLQHALHREVARAMDDFDALGGAGVIMDARTGEVLAGVSLPDYNPHHVGAAKKAERFNRLTLGVYELGSVFKVFSVAAYLDAFAVNMSKRFDAKKPLKIGRFRISDYHPQKRDLTIPEVFVHSSNIGTALMAQELGADRLRDFYQDLGLLSALDVEIAEAASPLLPNRWGDVATMTASYGHGLATTPLHVAAAMAMVVNGGYYVRPTFIKSENPSGDKTDQRLRVMSEETSYKMRELLRLAVQAGTSRKANVQGYKVGGKTGTAEKHSASGGYDRKRLVSSFVGAFPMDDPRYVIYIAIDEPKGQKHSYGYATAGWVAAPAFARTVSSVVSILGIVPQPDAPSYKNPLQIYVAEEG